LEAASKTKAAIAILLQPEEGDLVMISSGMIYQERGKLKELWYGYDLSFAISWLNVVLY